MIDRRALVLGSAAATIACSEIVGEGRAAKQALTASPDFRRLQAALGEGGRLGVAAVDTGTGRSLGHDADGRYAMCSTFKAALAAAWLAEVDRGARSLSDEIAFSQADLTEYAPVTRANLSRGRLTVEQLCAAIVEVSDNAAANLLLRPLGGPAGLTAFFRRCGDRVSRLDRYEEVLGSNILGDPRDTTSPAAMLGLMRNLLLGDVLTPASRARLIGWMEGASTGLRRLRSGMPAGWRVGDKTGNGANGAANDVAIAWPPNRPPILIASYMSGGTAERPARDALHAEVARLVASAFG